MKFLRALILILTISFLGCPAEPESTPNQRPHAAALKLDTLLHRMNSVQYLNKLPESDFDSLIVWFAASSGPADSGSEVLHPVLDKIAHASEGDSYFIEALLRLDAVVSSNVELSESLPKYIAKAATLNPGGFTKLYMGFTVKRRREAIALLTFPMDTKVVPPFRDLSNSTRDPAVKQFAGMIADSLEANL